MQTFCSKLTQHDSPSFRKKLGAAFALPDILAFSIHTDPCFLAVAHQPPLSFLYTTGRCPMTSHSSHQTAPAVVLLSGGLDSTTTLAIAMDKGFTCSCLSFSYGQRQSVELERARAIAQKMNAARHLILSLDLGKIGGSALTADIAVPKARSLAEISHDIPVTYVPARNIIFLSHAVAWAETIGAQDIFIGVNALDYSGYPDCRPAFISAFEQAVNLGTKAGSEKKKFHIHTPLIHNTKAEIIQKGIDLRVDYALTHSCYDPGIDGLACAQCDSCLLRIKGFAEAGVQDPIAYQTRKEDRGR